MLESKTMTFNEIDAVISDMDGVLWRGGEPLPGIQTLFAVLRQRDIPFVLATNNSGNHPDDYISKLANMGVPDIRAEHIITAGTATADYLQQRYEAGTRIHVVGRDGLRRVLREAGFVLADEDVAAVVVGIDFDFDYERAKRAALLIRYEGAAFIGTNPDVTFPAPEGLVPGAGSMIAMIAAAVDVAPTVIGKPEPAMFEVALQRIGSSAGRTLMIGDRLNTDIEGALQVGLRTALVLTGVTTREQAIASDTQPDDIFDALPDLLTALQATE